MRYFLEVISLARKTYTPLGEYIKERVEFYLKEISKDGIEKLIKNGFIKLSGRGGYVNPKTHQDVSVVKTVHGRHYYTEDFYADMAAKLK